MGWSHVISSLLRPLGHDYNVKSDLFVGPLAPAAAKHEHAPGLLLARALDFFWGGGGGEGAPGPFPPPTFVNMARKLSLFIEPTHILDVLPLACHLNFPASLCQQNRCQV